MKNQSNQDITEAIRDTLQAYLPTALNDADLPIVRDWVLEYMPPPRSENCPYGWILSGDWKQKTRTDGGIGGARIQRIQPWTIAICQVHADESILGPMMKNYVDVLTAVIEAQYRFGTTTVEDSNVLDGGVGRGVEGLINSMHFQTAGVLVEVIYSRTLGVVS